MKTQSQDNFCIISHNCWGAEIYKELNLPYNTPFVGLFIPSACYIKMLSNAKYWLDQSMTFTLASRYDFYNNFRKSKNDVYPIGLLGNEIEIHFMHYSDEKEALEKWKRRLARMPVDQDRWYIEFSYREVFDEDEIKSFDKLPFKNKVFFSHKKMQGINSLVYLSEFENAKELFDGKALYNISKFYFNIIGWINRGESKVTIPTYLFRLLRDFARKLR